MRIPACSASIRATPDTAYDTGNFPEQDSSSRLELAPTTSRAEEKNAQGGEARPEGERRSPLCRVSCTSLSPWVRPRVRYRKEKEKENTEKKRRKSNFLKRRLSNIREEKKNLSFSTLTKISNKIEKSVEFILKKENIRGQVFFFFLFNSMILKFGEIFPKNSKTNQIYTRNTIISPISLVEKIILEKIHFFLLICFSQ